MNQILSKSPPLTTWIAEHELMQADLPEVLNGIITESGSLTERLRIASNHGLNVKVLRQQSCELGDFPQQRLAGCSGRGLLREVYLMSKGRELVFAQTLVPDRTLKSHPWLGELGEQPLGKQLFSRADVQRQPLEYARLAVADPLLDRASAGLAQALTPPGEAWARRSVFLVSGDPVLVNEVFFTAAMLPANG